METYLEHHGILGQKWGVRRYQNPDGSYTAEGKKRHAGENESSISKKVNDTKSAYKTAKKEYKKSFNKAYNYSNAHPIGQYTNEKKKAESDKRWDDAIEKADKVNKTKLDYKTAKTERKNAIKDTINKINKEASLRDKLVYNNATRTKAAKYVVDNNMSMEEANQKAKTDAWRNTAIFVAGYGAITLASIYKINH